eukprot:scaffold32876_cov46-Cyclotella_meneghiniana.AAC.5
MLSSSLRKTLSSPIARCQSISTRHHGIVSTKALSRSTAIAPRLVASSLTTHHHYYYEHRALSTNALRADSDQPTSTPSSSSSIDQAAAETTTPFVSTPNRKYQYFTNVTVTPSGVAVITFDNPTKKVNTLSFSVMREATSLWNDEISNNSNIKSIVFTSAKDACFIAGADIFDISSVEDKKALVPVIEEALMFFLKMKEKGVPMVAAIHGPALGGGLEWGESYFFGV